LSNWTIHLSRNLIPSCVLRRELKSNTAMKYIRMRKQVTNDVVRRNWLVKNPFAQFKYTFKWPDREVLTSAELGLLVEKDLSVERIAQVRDYFVFSCYTGLSYIDMVNLHHSNVIVRYRWKAMACL
jgi:integrase/recombinase XerD